MQILLIIVIQGSVLKLQMGAISKENESQILVLDSQIKDFLVLMIEKVILGLVMKIVQFHT